MPDTTICENFGTVLACGNCEIQMYDKNLTQLPLSQVARLLIAVTDMVNKPGSSKVVRLVDCTAYCGSMYISHQCEEYISPNFEHHRTIITSAVYNWGQMAERMNIEEPDEKRKNDYCRSFLSDYELERVTNYDELLECLVDMYLCSDKDNKTARYEVAVKVERKMLLEERDRIIAESKQ